MTRFSSRRLLAALGAALALATCPVAFSAAAESRGAVPAAGASKARAAAPRQILPWIEDDWTRAMAEAKARKLPIFVESWAPW